MTHSKRLTAVLALILGLLVASVNVPALAAPTGPSDQSGEFSNEEGSLEYLIHLPPSYEPGGTVPLLVALHGCLMTGSGLNSMEDNTALSEVADENGFAVVYPDQSRARNLQRCWNFDRAEDQVRDSGEPSLIAGMTRSLVEEFDLDPRRVYVAGGSSGAMMAVIMGVTHPDLYAAIGSLAGCEYACELATLAGREDPSPIDTAEQAFEEMGSRARPVPAIVFQGTADPVVRPEIGERLVAHLAHLDDLAIDGEADGDVSAEPDSVEPVEQPGERPFTRSLHTASGDETVLIESIVVDGLGHAWSGRGEGPFNDPAGPDASELLWAFLSAHALPDGAGTQ